MAADNNGGFRSVQIRNAKVYKKKKIVLRVEYLMIERNVLLRSTNEMKSKCHDFLFLNCEYYTHLLITLASTRDFAANSRRDYFVYCSLRSDG